MGYMPLCHRNKPIRIKEIRDGREIRHYMPLTAECFESIYFGVNTEQKEKDKIIQYVRTKFNPQINLYQMTIDDNAFRLQPIKI